MEKTEEKKSIRYIDYNKALLMILVIMGHINFANQAIKAWIYAFHMPAFFFASGMLMKDGTVSDIRTGLRLLWKKFQSLMLPCLLWALIYSSLELPNLAYILYGSHQTLAKAGSLSSLWFLPCLFVATVLFLLSQLVFNKRFIMPIKLALATVSFCIAVFFPAIKNGYPWCVNVAFSAFGFLLIGNILFPLIQKTHAKMIESKVGPALCVGIMCLSFTGSLLYQLNIPASGYIIMANGEYGNSFLFILCACMGTVSILSLSFLFDRFLPVLARDPLSFLGQNTLCAFAVQKPIITVFHKLFEIIRVPYAVSLIVTCVGTGIACCLFAVFINRYLPVMAGRIQKQESFSE